MAFAPFCIFPISLFTFNVLLAGRLSQYSVNKALLGGRLTRSHGTMSPPDSSSSIQHPPSLTRLTGRERDTLFDERRDDEHQLKLFIVPVKTPSLAKGSEKTPLLICQQLV